MGYIDCSKISHWIGYVSDTDLGPLCNAGNFRVYCVFSCENEPIPMKMYYFLRDPRIKFPLCIYVFFLLSWVSGWTQVTQVRLLLKAKTKAVDIILPCKSGRPVLVNTSGDLPVRWWCFQLSAFHTSLWIRLSTSNFSLVKTLEDPFTR